MLAPLRRRFSLLSRTAAVLVAAGTVVSLAGPAPAGVPSSGARTHVVTDRRHVAIRVPHTFFGLHDNSQQAYGRVAFGSIRLWDSGVTWREVETAPGVYNWTRLDSLVSNAQAHGVQVTLVLAMTPSFYGPAATLPPTDLTHYADYVRAVMTRYRDFNGRRGIAAYQVWNEGNISSFWTGTMSQLAQLTQVVHDVGAQVDPGATIVAPSFAVRLPYQRRWFAHYQSRQVDGVPVWHFYDANALSLYPMATYAGRPGGPEDAMSLVADARRLLARAGAPAGLPIWGSEINFGLPSGSPGKLTAAPIPNRQQIANVLRTYLLGAARGLARLYWYRYDMPLHADGATIGNTLLADPTDPTQVTVAGRSLTTVEGWLHGRLVGIHGHRPCAQDSHGTYTCIVRSTTGVRRIYWNPTHTVRIPLPAGAVYRQRGLRQRTRIPRTYTSVRVDRQPVMLESPR